MTEQKPTQKTASQRIDDLENGLRSVYHTLNVMAKDLGTLKEAAKLLGTKMDAIVQVIKSGEPLSEGAISKAMIQINVDDLRIKVENLINSGLLSPTETVTENCFVVGRELTESGEVANPRMQFILQTLKEDLRNKFMGAKVGQNLMLEEGKWTFEVQEIYRIVEPQQVPEAPVVESKDAPVEAHVAEVVEEKK
jgi:hypothetical protein